MNKNNIKKLIKTLGFSKFLAKYKKIIDVNNLWNCQHGYDKVAEVFYNIYYDTSPPICPNGQKKSFIDFCKGYRENSCFLSKNDTCKCLKIYRKNKSLKIHKDMSPYKKKKMQEKIKETMIERYGVENAFQSEKIKEKIKETNLEKYGVEYITQNSEIKEKIKETSLEKYGTEHPSQTEEFQNKRKQTLVERYGTTETFFSPIIKEKIKETMLERHGVENAFQSEKIKEKIKETNLEKYGVENIGSRNLSEETKDIINDKEKYIDFSRNKSFELVAKELNMSSTRIAEISRQYDCLDSMSIGKGSVEQHILENYIKELNVKTETNNRQIIKPLEIDIFLPDFNIAIEYNGIYWHTELSGGKNRHYHQNKLLECNKKDIDIIQIFSDDWLTNNNIIKSMIKSKLNLNQKIYARKTQIKFLTERESNIFFEENHLKSSINNSTKNYGLIYENEIIYAMSFQLKNNIWYLTRFSSKINTNVIGGASKIFKYFIKEMAPMEIHSYCDLCYFSGKIYETLGFHYNGIIEPKYYYTKKGIRYYKTDFIDDIKQNKYVDKTEKEIMLDLGYDIIWDCGHSKWLWKNNKEEENIEIESDTNEESDS